MHIVFDARYITNSLTGIGQYTDQLMRQLVKVEDFSCIIIHEPGISFENGFETIQSPVSFQSHPFQEIWLSFTLKKLKKRLGTLLFYSPAFHLPYLVNNIPGIPTIHDMTSFLFPETIPKKFGYYMRYSIRRSARLSDCIIVDTHAVKEELEMLVPQSRNKIHVIHSGLHPMFFSPEPGENNQKTILKKYGLPPNYFLAVGTLEPRKNIINLVKAMELLPDAYQFPLIMVGKPGWCTNRFEQVLQKGLGKGLVRTIGYIPGDDLRILIKNALLSIFIPLYEGFGLPLLESMACGTPVVASDIPSLKEIGNDIPFYCDPMYPRDIRNTIINIIESRDLVEQKIQAGIVHAKKFTWDRVASNVFDIVKSILHPD